MSATSLKIPMQSKHLNSIHLTSFSKTFRFVQCVRTSKPLCVVLCYVLCSLALCEWMFCVFDSLCYCLVYFPFRSVLYTLTVHAVACVRAVVVACSARWMLKRVSEWAQQVDWMRECVEERVETVCNVHSIWNGQSHSRTLCVVYSMWINVCRQRVYNVHMSRMPCNQCVRSLAALRSFSSSQQNSKTMEKGKCVITENWSNNATYIRYRAHINIK